MAFPAARRCRIRSLRRLIPYLKKYRVPIASGVVAMLLATGFSRLIPWLLKLAIDKLRAGTALTEILPYIAGMVAAAAAGGLFLYLQRWLLIGSSRRVEYDVRGDLFAHVQSLDLAYFGEKKTGDLMAHFTNDLNAVRDVAGPGLMYAVQMTTALVVSITLMIIIDPILTLFAFLPYPMISVVTFLYGKRMYQSSRRVQDLFGVMSSRVQEDLAGARVIRAYVQEANSARRFRAVNEDYLRANMSVAHLRGRFIAAMSALAGSGIAIALLVGGRQVIREELTLGSLVAFTAYLAELTWPVIAIGWVVSVLQRGASAMGRLAEVFDAEPGIVSGPARGRPRARVAFEHVSFRYPGTRENALTGVSFRLETGRTLGIVGRTGSGKSTILKLLLRFYDPTEGRVLLDGVDLRERNLDEIRTVVGYAPQDAFLFSRTLGQNIAHGVPDAEPAHVRAVADQAGLTDEVDGFPDGFDTLVGERGVTLSGGQRQRASLARALLLDPDVLILDDTLSSVDAETEERILRELRRYVSNRTALIVSHRISAVQEADFILVLDRGRIIEEGTHGQLVRRDGLYARMHERQRLVAEIERAS